MNHTEKYCKVRDTAALHLCYNFKNTSIKGSHKYESNTCAKIKVSFGGGGGGGWTNKRLRWITGWKGGLGGPKKDYIIY